MSRTEQRIQTMNILYQIFLYQKNNIEYNLDTILKNNADIINNFSENIITGVLNKQTEIDNLANKYLDSWQLFRLSLTDQAIIRIAIYELMYTDTPNKVCIDEAIEISKKYSDEQVTKMINGILDKILHNEVENEQ